MGKRTYRLDEATGEFVLVDTEQPSYAERQAVEDKLAEIKAKRDEGPGQYL